MSIYRTTTKTNDMIEKIQSHCSSIYNAVANPRDIVVIQVKHIFSQKNEYKVILDEYAGKFILSEQYVHGKTFPACNKTEFVCVGR